ncbi:MAG: P-type HAD superfamily ATPase [Fusobacteria bacterium]|nr:MAG: P-type HAD superfamily ATPase [Fusobacteriota bacterium]KAF0228936.1 MAG: P-type HAD superfamily [Fusobacteriota bacterium]
MDKNKFYCNSIDNCLDIVDSTREGLSDLEAKKRLEEFGLNQLPIGKKKGPLRIFLSQFSDFMIWILIFAGGISGFLGEWVDAAIILFVVVLNSILGTIQEYKAEEALAALKKMAAPHALVLRNGSPKKVLSHELVPGDVVMLNAGDTVPGDMRLIESFSLKIDESTLTGESVAEEKVIDIMPESASIGDRDNMAFMGTAVTYGRGTGVIVGTGLNTQMGYIAKSLSKEEKEKTPLQKKLNQLSNYISIGVILIAILIFFIGFLTDGHILDSFLIAISLAVAAIPEGMVAVITIVLALGMSKLAAKGAIIRKLPAVETLGGTQVICSDKTGTLTQNKMTVMEIYSKDEELLYEAMLHCNDSVLNEKGKLMGDPTESALLDYLLDKDHINKNHIDERVRDGEIPFDSVRKKSSVVIELDDKHRIFVKGAVDNMLDSFNITAEQKAEINQENERMANKALRVLAFGYRDLHSHDGAVKLSMENDLEFVGLVGMIDPPREEVLLAIKDCRTADIIPVMITGDHKITAMAIARDIGLLDEGRYAITGAELALMSDDEFNKEIDHIGVYARVSPDDKVRIVNTWQNKGMIVAMTGDGVNDAPALKTADIGVGMGITGTEVSKGASDMVLTDDNFATIVVAVREGRRIFDNIQKTISFLLSSNAGEVVAILVATIIGWRFLSPVHILWINLVTDSMPALALGMEPAEKDIMVRPPRDSRGSIFTSRNIMVIGFMGVMEALLALGAYGIGFYIFNDGIVATTMAFVTLGAAQLFASLGFQSRSDSVFNIKIKAHPMLWLSFGGGLLMQLLVVLIPPISRLFGLTALSGMQWLIVAVLSFFMLLFVELFKFFNRDK